VQIRATDGQLNCEAIWFIINTVWLVITSKCNNSCSFCYYKKRSEEMSLETIKKYVELLNKIKPKKIILIGGEPTLHPNFVDIVELFYKNNFNISVVSNGFGFSNLDVVKNIIYKVKNISLSIEGTKNVHNSIVKNNSAYDSIVKSIKNIQLFNKIPSTNTVLNKENINNIESIISDLYDLGLRKFTFNICTSFEKYDNISYSPKDLIKDFEPILRRLIKKYNDSTFHILTSLAKCVISKDLQKHFNHKCHIFSESGLVIDSNNEILLCTHWVDYPLAKLNPDISYNDFKELWQKLSKYRLEVAKRPIKECSICSEKINCYGGCPIFWKVNNPKDHLKII
jgi:radical SAM protein with 4Fe4S-binding SPASM domain